jgi:hypothetical protein
MVERDIMPTPAELREASRQARLAVAKEPDPHLKRRLANHAFALAQLAEKMERAAAAPEALAS